MPRRPALRESRPRVGASEHTTSESIGNGLTPHVEITGAVAFVKMGISAMAMRESDWHQKYRSQLLQKLQAVLMEKQLLGLCLCGVGSRDCPLTTDAQSQIEELLHEAAKCREDIAKVNGDKQFQIVWPRRSRGTLTMWRPNLKVEVLPTFKKACTDGGIQRFRVWLTNDVSLLIFNQHTRFQPGLALTGCMKIISAGVAEHRTERTNVGFLAGGWGGHEAWIAAALCDQQRAQVFAPMTFVYAPPGVAQHDGRVKTRDCYVVMGADKLKADGPRRNRNTSPDVVFVEWSCQEGGNYKCPHCDGRSRGGFTWEPIGYPICTVGAASCLAKAVKQRLCTRELVQTAKYKPIFENGKFKDEKLIGAVFKAPFNDKIFALL